MKRRIKIRKVYLIYKRSVYQKFFIDEKNAKFKKLFRQKHFSITSMRDIHRVHLNAVRTIQNHLKKRGIAYETESRHHVPDLKGFDLVVTIGGDGTFLRTAHFVKNQLILPVNSDPLQSVGALCSIPIHEFRNKMDEILSGTCRIRELPLMQVRVNKRRLSVAAINDVLFTNMSPAATSRYYIKNGEIIEEHKSSGVWIATATGSTAAICGAGGKPMPISDKRLQFAVREPYQGNFHPYKLTRGFVKKGRPLVIVSKMMQSHIYLDGPTNAVDLNYGDEVELSLAKTVLRVVV